MSEIVYTDDREGVIFSKPLGDGRELTIAPMLFGKYRLHIGEEASPFTDDGW